jgi:hypothetical protein
MLHWQMFSTLAVLVLFASDVALAIPQRGGGGDQNYNFPAWWHHERSDDSSPGFWNSSSERTYGHNLNSLSK